MTKQKEKITSVYFTIQSSFYQIGKLYFYYGEDDGWSPLSYRENLIKRVPEFDNDNNRVDTNGIPHAFVEEDGVNVGKIVGDWIKERLNN